MESQVKLSERLCQKLATAHALQKAASADGELSDGVKMQKVNIADAAKSGVVADLQKNTFKNENGSLPGDTSNATEAAPDTGAQQGVNAAAVVEDYDPADTDAQKVLGATDSVIKTASALLGRVEAIAGMNDSDVDAAMAKYASADFRAEELDPQEALQVCENVLVKMANAGFEPAQQLIDFAVSYDQGVRKKASDMQELMEFARTNPMLQKAGAAEDPAVAAAILNNAAEQSPLDVMVDPNTGALADGIDVSDLPESEQAALAAASQQTAEDMAAADDEDAVIDAAADAAVEAGMSEEDVAAVLESQLQGAGVPVDDDEATIDALADAAVEAGMAPEEVAGMIEEAAAGGAAGGAAPADEEALAVQAVQDLGAQIEAEAGDLTVEVAAQIQEADPTVTDEEALDAATEAVTDAITAAVSAQAGGMATSDGTPLVSDEKVGEVVDAMEKTASANPARGMLVNAINNYFGLDTSAFEQRAAAYLAKRNA